MFRFFDSAWLGALAAIPVLAALFWVAGRQRRKALDAFGDHELVRRLTASVSVAARRWKAALTLAAVTCTVLALARPQFGTRVETVRSLGQDIVVAVDLSRSMLAEDVSPNRLERARLAIFRLMDGLDGDRIGLVAFAADAFVQSPLTTDYAAAGMFLNAMHPDIMPVQGTDLGAALRVSLDALDQGARDSRVVVIVTDGEDHEDDFEEALQRAVGSGVRVHVVGIGSTEGVPIPVFDAQGRREGFLRDEDGTVVTTRLGEQTLRTVAERTGARYVTAGLGGGGFDDLVDELAGAEGEALEERQVTLFEEQFQIFLGFALALLMLDWLLPERRRTRAVWVGRFGLGLLATGMLLGSPQAIEAQSGRSQVQEGNRLYEEGRFQEAHEKYLEGLAAAPESELILFNDGNALYQGQDYERAVEAYQRAIESDDPALQSTAWYNLGNALYRGQQLEESLEAFKQSLRLNPDDTDAKHNLERVLEQLQQQQQDQQQDEQDQQQDDDQQEQESDQQQQSDPGDNDDQQEQQQDQDPGQQDQPQDPGDDSAQDEQSSPQPQPGEMTQEEAERLLDAVEEDPDDVNRRRAPATGRRPRNPW